jgi:DNA-binding CsgD family transcriptional regulator
VAAELDDASARAAARGATAAAAGLSELARELTPDDPALARQRGLRAATAYRLSGSGDRAALLLEQLLTEVPSGAGAERSDLLLELGITFRSDRLTAVALFDEALSEAADDDARSARILANRSLQKLLATDVQGALADARAALERAERTGDPSLVATAIARLVHAEVYAVEITPDLLERGVEMEESPRFFFGRRLVTLGDIDRAQALFENLVEEAGARGDEHTKVASLWYLSLAEWFGGRLRASLANAIAASELGELIQFGHALAWVGRVRAFVQGDLGLVDEARRSAEDGLAFARGSANESYVITTLAALGRLELALGNAVDAGDRLRDLPERMFASGWNDPTQCIVPDAIESLVALGELDLARGYLDHYARYAARSPNALAAMWEARCRGLLAAASGDLDTSFAAFEAALAPSADTYRLERGRTLLCLGSVRRQAQQKKAARETLEQALAVFEELGAQPWAERARGELRRISGRAPSPEELTETERRVAELAAKGRTNKEIAAELFMGLSTVEAHLSHVYRKLGVRRAELATQLAPAQGEPAKAGGAPVQT